MKERIFKYVALALLVFLWTNAANAVVGCDCEGNKTEISEALYNDMDAIFTGTVVSSGNRGKSKGYKFKVNKLWKGSKASTITVFSSGECGYAFVTGNTYLVVAKRYEKVLETSICLPNLGYNDAKQEIQDLNQMAHELRMSASKVDGNKVDTNANSTPKTQGPPGSEILLLDLKIQGDFIGLSDPQNITNRVGYDNQPMFSYRGKYVYYTAMLDNQTDIFRYELESGKTERITNTPTSEYSPSMMPNHTHFSTVLVEEDSTQRLWRYPMEGGQPFVINKKITDVGYHCWMGSNNYAMFIIGKPNTLQVASVGDRSGEVMTDNIGRCIQKNPKKSAINFVKKGTTSTWIIQEMNFYTHDITNVIETPSGSEDFAWTPEGTLLMAKDNILYKLRPDKDDDWKTLKVFDPEKVKNITRLAINREGTRLVMVVDE